MYHHHLTPMFHSNWFPFRSFGDTGAVHSLSESRAGARTIEPSYVYEADDTTARFEIELPGVARDGLSIEVNEHKLTVRGKRFRKRGGCQGTEEANNGTVTEQDSAGSSPSLIYLLEARLGHSADLDNIKADLCGDGILLIDVPMKTRKETRKIQIEV